jgi:hypothetical protein
VNRDQVSRAIEKAKKGIAQYIEIMELLPRVDVSCHASFQRKYNAFYRVRQRPEAWYVGYYSLMQASKGTQPTFEQIIDRLYLLTSRYEPSFSSKLVATLNPRKPVWDVHILKNTGHTPPAYTAKNKIELAKAAYFSIERWYQEFLRSDDGKVCIEVFDELVPDHEKITNLKKVDFILWQMRA